jgi:glycoprotein 6-alpha-L-fucosyltransferase
MISIENFKSQHEVAVQHIVSHERLFHHNGKLIASNLSREIQKRFNESQNPVNCNDRKFIVCDLLDCGFGCQMHQLVYCLNEALKQNRTLLLDDKNWKYKQDGFEAYFKPLSQTCKNVSTDNPVLWHGKNFIPIAS